ncbi:MAG: hypothetical protein WDN49_19285 [Acetobacteraceae bacterium]
MLPCVTASVRPQRWFGVDPGRVVRHQHAKPGAVIGDELHDFPPLRRVGDLVHADVEPAGGDAGHQGSERDVGEFRRQPQLRRQRRDQADVEPVRLVVRTGEVERRPLQRRGHGQHAGLAQRLGQRGTGCRVDARRLGQRRVRGEQTSRQQRANQPGRAPPLM